MKYCTYLTIYSGDKLPPFYIGSTSIDKYNNGYCGSVKSKKYKAIWDQELKDNRHLFDTILLTEHDTRKEATIQELAYQIQKDVVKSPDFINMALATPNGFFGMDTSGDNHPTRGKQIWKDKVHPFQGKTGELSANYGKKHSEETIQKMRDSHPRRSGEDHPCYGKRGEETGMYGKHHTEETKQHLREKLTGYVHSVERNEKISLKLTGIKRSEEVKAAQRERLKATGALKGENNPMYGKKRKRTICEHCGKDTDTANYKKWHGEKCRNKTEKG